MIRRPIKILLISSLLLNLLMISTIVGLGARFWWQGHIPFWGDIPSAINTNHIAHIIDEIPNSAQAAFYSRLRQLQRDDRRRSAEIAEHRRALRTIIADDPFDPEAFMRLGEKISAAKQQSEHAYTLFLRDLMALMPTEERTEHAKRLIYKRRLPKEDKSHDD